ncbi:MAG: ATP-binding protein [Akkermansia sp.]
MDIPTDWELYGDPLLDANSVQFGGKRPQAKHGAGTFHYCGRRQNTGRCVITVTDTGVGIPAESIPFLFNRFYRVETHHSSEIRGTGLGLSIVKRAVEAHDGASPSPASPTGKLFYHHHSPEKIPGRKEDTATITGID